MQNGRRNLAELEGVIKRFDGEKADAVRWQGQEMSLTRAVKEVTALHGIPFSAAHTRLYGTGSCAFRCALARKVQCPVILNFRIEEGMVRFRGFVGEHNHDLDPLYISTVVNPLTPSEREVVAEKRKEGVAPGRIRADLPVPVRPDDLYNASRSEVDPSSQIKNLYDLAQTKYQEKWHVHIHENDDSEFCGMTMISARLKDCPWAGDVCLADDTTCTNYTRFPIMLLASFDIADHIQILAIGVLPDKTSSAFAQFFADVCAEGICIRSIILDRLEAQLSALLDVFPECRVAFCRVHIERNFRGVQAVAKLLGQLFSGTLNTADFLSKLEELPSSRKIQLLIEQINFYAPSELSELRLRKHRTTNGIEGAFGNVKRSFSGTLLPIGVVVDAFVRFHDLQIQNLLSVKYEIDDFLCAIPLPANIMELLRKEFLAMQKVLRKGVTRERCTEECKCRHELWQEYGLPCKCRLLDLWFSDSGVPLLDAAAVPQWLKDGAPQCNACGSVSATRGNRSTERTYQDYVAHFSQMADVAPRNPEVRAMLDDTIKRYQAMDIRVAGRPRTVPSKLCGGQRRRKRKIYRCKICGKPGHNRTTCPQGKGLAREQQAPAIVEEPVIHETESSDIMSPILLSDSSERDATYDDDSQEEEEDTEDGVVDVPRDVLDFLDEFQYYDGCGAVISCLIHGVKDISCGSGDSNTEEDVVKSYCMAYKSKGQAADIDIVKQFARFQVHGCRYGCRPVIDQISHLEHLLATGCYLDAFVMDFCFPQCKTFSERARLITFIPTDQICCRALPEIRDVISSLIIALVKLQASEWRLIFMKLKEIMEHSNIIEILSSDTGRKFVFEIAGCVCKRLCRTDVAVILTYAPDSWVSRRIFLAIVECSHARDGVRAPETPEDVWQNYIQTIPTSEKPWILSVLTFNQIILYYDAHVIGEDGSIPFGDETHEHIASSVSPVCPQIMVITEDLAQNHLGDCVKFVQSMIKMIMYGHQF